MFSRWIVTNITSASVTTFLAFLAGIISWSVYCTQPYYPIRPKIPKQHYDGNVFLQHIHKYYPVNPKILSQQVFTSQPN
jgi:hypothetical protein